MEKEEWRDIKGYEGFYEVSNLGRIRSSYFKSEYGYKKIKRLYKGSGGYYRVILNKHGKKKTFIVHRLVAIAFIPNPNNYPCVNHKDETRTNNNANNLEWCTYKYNTNYGHCLEKRKTRRSCKSFQKPVKQMKNGEVIKVYESIAQAVRELNLGEYADSNITQTCKKARWHKSAYGFEWEYVEV